MRIIYLFIKSLLFAGLITFSVYKLLQWYYHNHVYYGETFMYYRQAIKDIGDVYVFLVIYIPLALLIFYLQTRTYTRYFNQISEGIRHLADGDFAHVTTIPSNDEFNRIALDINDASSRLKQAIEAQTLSQTSKQQLIANLAHDLRTPLTSVIGYLNLLQNAQQLPKAQVEEFTRIAYTKSQYLEELIETLFDLSKFDLSPNLSEQSRIDLHELLLQLIDEMYPLFDEANAAIEKTIEPDLFVIGNGKELARVFENLLSNALRYGDLSRPILVAAKKIDKQIVIQVTNHGEPIPEKDLAHLFDMFYTVEQSRTFSKKQSGLGLYIAKTIIEKHHGSITVANEGNKIQFEIVLPSE